MINDIKFLQDVERFKLVDPKSFRYLNQSSCYELDGVNDAEEYIATRRAMDVVGISETEQVCTSGLSPVDGYIGNNLSSFVSLGCNFQSCGCHSPSWKY